jgi:hypothetical protein
VHTPISQANSPVACVESVEKVLKMFADVPRMLLGYEPHMLKNNEHIRMRQAVISMCSYASSVSPRVSADCLKTAPTLQSFGMCGKFSLTIRSICVNLHVFCSHRRLYLHKRVFTGCRCSRDSVPTDAPGGGLAQRCCRHTL